MLKWEKKPNGRYESNIQYWDESVMKHKPLYTIRKLDGGYALYLKGNQKRYDNVKWTVTLKEIKQFVQELENEKPCLSDLDHEMASPDAAAGMSAVWITRDGNGGAWHIDQNGVRIDD